jgi:acyl homoserine lactone synthase
MAQLFIGKREEIPQEALEGMFRLRHKVFHEILGWDVEVHEGQERDRFDDLETYYAILHEPEQKLALGCLRLLPTMGPYMLRDVFPQLLHGEAAPCSPHVWEVSRFATTPTNWKAGRDQASFGTEALRMLQATIEFGHQRGIHSFVAATSVLLESKLSRIMEVRHFGNGLPVNVGGVLSTACWIDVERSRRRLAISP